MESKNKYIKCWKKNKTTIVDHWYNNQFSEKNINDWKIKISQFEPNVIKKNYLLPLLELLIYFIKTNDEKILHVYLDERLRYAPHKQSLEKRVEFFSSILEKDFEILFSLLTDKNTAKHAKETLISIHAPLLEIKKNRASLLAIGDCLMNEIRVFLPHLFKEENFQVDMRCIYFSALMDKGLSIKEISDFMEKNDVDMIAISFFSFLGISSYKLLMKEIDHLEFREIFTRGKELTCIAENYLFELRTITDAPIILHNISGLPLSRYRKRIPFINPLSIQKVVFLELMRQELLHLSNGIENCILLDEIFVVEKYGYHKCSTEVTPKWLSRNSMFHTSTFGYHLSELYKPLIKKYIQFKKIKAICVDFDNTLWNGVIGDEEVEHYFDRQSLLKTLKDQGLILIAVSKNSIENIKWDEMLLKRDDFAILKINWNLKVKSICEAAAELNLGIDSFLFIDDNQAELDLAAREIPDLICFDASLNQTWEDLKYLLKFPNTKNTKESRNRTNMYQSQLKRKSFLKAEHDYPSMMNSLGLKSSFREASDSDLKRIEELVTRTNQFNTTTIRYNKSQLKEFLKNNNEFIFVSELEDKFGKLGIVCIIIIKLNETELIFDTFIMSCRAMGFSLENKMISNIVNRFHEKHRFIGRYVQTDRNSPCSKLYENAGFTQIDEENWLLCSNEINKLQNVTWIDDM